MKHKLNHYDTDRPVTALDYLGTAQAIKYPKGTTIARCGRVFLIQTSKVEFATVYALETKTGLRWAQVADEFAGACFHQAVSEGIAI